MIKFLKSRTTTTGFAMFAMFFGAGNVVFPLSVGQHAQDGNFWAIIGLLITAVGVPFLGLVSMTLFSGDYQKFFGRIGKIPGFIVSLLIIFLIGPLGALPRTIALSYSTTKMFLPNLSLPIFSAIACLIVFLFTFRKNKIIDIIGHILTPLLLGSLMIIIIKGLITGPPLTPTDYQPVTMFLHGLYEGYQTMDLLGAFFFSTVIIASLKKAAKEEEGDSSPKKLMSLTLKASAIGGSLLSLVYCGFSYVAALWSESLAVTRADYFLGSLAIEILGPYAGILACVAVALACLTTAIALAAVSSEFLHYDILKDRVSYLFSLTAVLITTYFISTLDFTGIMEFLAPILEVCYPALILLSLLNMGYKLWGFKSVKIPITAVFIISLWGTLT
ncbi:branched-chain amino acid transport system II carrier protein [Chlamydiales bacterium]|nr:branched-chain amino acid transport system II carrier protein [Chlamydiales bacterium]